jgi:predicted secreted protein
MAQAQTFRFSGVRVLVGDGADPEIFAAPCGFTERSLSLSKDLGETNTPDCLDEDAASWTERDVTAKSASITGQGVLAADALPTWQAFFDSDVSTKCRVELWRAGAKVGQWEGAFQLETLEIGATRGERATINVTLQSDGALAWTAGAGV